MESFVQPVPSREEGEPLGPTTDSEIPGSRSTHGDASDRSAEPTSARGSNANIWLPATGENALYAADSQREDRSPPGTLALLQQLHEKRQARDSKMWDVEDLDVLAAQLTEVTVRINPCQSDATNDSLSAETSVLCCHIRRAQSSLEFENASSVPYHAQYRRLVEEEDDAEMDRLLRQLGEEHQAIRDLAVAQRYQIMHDQLALIQKQLGNENAKIPDLEWLIANDPENNQELDEVIAVFAARDNDLPQEVPQAPDIPLTCKNFFCRCPWRDDMRKDERALATTVPFRQHQQPSLMRMMPV